jgi:hypothetical protein
MKEKGLLVKIFVNLHEQTLDTKINQIGWVVIGIPKFNPVGNVTPHEGEGLLVEISVLHKPFVIYE